MTTAEIDITIEKNSKRCLQKQIMLNATLNDFKKTKLYFGVYNKKFNDNTSYLQKRVKSWNKFYQDYNVFRDYSKNASIKLIQENSEYLAEEQETTNEEEVEVTTNEEEEEENGFVDKPPAVVIGRAVVLAEEEEETDDEREPTEEEKRLARAARFSAPSAKQGGDPST